MIIQIVFCKLNNSWLINSYNEDEIIEHINWTLKEFKVFLLIYASQTNFIETQEELDFIESRFSIELINQIRAEIKKLNDFQKSKLIIDHIKSNNYSQHDLDEILLDIKELYESDGIYDSLEKSVFSMLRKILKVD